MIRNNQGLGLMSQWFTSPNYKGDISSPTNICFGDLLNKNPQKLGHQSQALLNKK